MRKFTFSFKSLLVAAGLLLGGANSAWADSQSESWKTTKDNPKSANTVLVDNDVLIATTTYATTNSGNSISIDGVSFSYYFEVRTNAAPTNVEPNGTESTGRTSIVFTPKYDGELAVYYRRQSTSASEGKGTYASNDGKDLKVFRQSDGSTMPGTLTIYSEISEGAYGYAKKVIELEANKTYTLYATSTTIQLYGFKYTYDDGWVDAWSRTFDDAYGITEFTGGNVETQDRSNTDATKVAAVFVGSGSKGAGYTFPTSTFKDSKIYEFSFDYAMSSLNNNTSSRSDFTLTSTDGTQMFKLKSAGASNEIKILVYIGTSDDPLSTTETTKCLYASNTSGGKGTNNKPKASHWYTIKVTADEDNGTWVTFTPQFTQSGYETISQKISDDVVFIGNLSASVGQYYGCLWLDNFNLKQNEFGKFVDNPGYVITRPDGTKRKFTLSCATEGATIYWATSELEKGAVGWTEYTSEVSTDATSVYAYAKKGDTTSDIINFETGAGSPITLNGATYSLAYYDISSSGFRVKVNDNQSGKLGDPTASLAYYTSNPEVTTDCASGDFITGFAPGSTVYVIASADGYASATTSFTFPARGAAGLTATWSDDLTGGGALTGGDTKTLGNASCQLITAIGGTTLSGNFGVYPDVGTNRWTPTTEGISPKNPYYIGAQNVSSAGYIKIVVDETSFMDSKVSARKNVTSSYVEKNADGSFSVFFKPSDNHCGFNTVSGLVIKGVAFYGDVPVTISSAIGVATLYTPYALDFSGVDDLEAYTATVEGDEVVVTKVTNVPANTGVILKGAVKSYEIPVIASSSTEQGDLTGNATEATAWNAFDGFDIYVLAMNGSGDAQFQKANEGSVAPGKAFLKISKTNPVKAFRVVDGTATGVEAPEVAEAEEEEILYNTAGVRVGKDYKGIVINQKGEKRLQK
jgi:hypothetical protein